MSSIWIAVAVCKCYAKSVQDLGRILTGRPGRPSEAEWGKDTYHRLTPFLIVSLGLKKPELLNDSDEIKARLVQAIIFIKNNPGHLAAKLLPARSQYGKDKKGWTDDRCRVSLWLTSGLAAAITAVAQDGEIKADKLPTSQCIKRLLTVAAALEGHIQDESWELPDYDSYILGKRND